MRETRVGVIVALALAALLGFMLMAGGGPGFLTKRREIDVVFRDAQGIRAGSPVRIAGIDAGRVSDVRLVPVEGTLLARVRVSLPADLAGRLRQDLKVTVQSGLTGQSLINIVDTGRSEQRLVAGQVVAGVESSFFDPVLKQVGLGPVERSHLSHTIEEVRQTIDVVGPRLRSVLGGLQETIAQLHQTVEVARPAVEASAQRVEDLARRLDAEKIEETLNRINTLVGHTEGLIAENRVNVQRALTTINSLAGEIQQLVVREGPHVGTLLEGFNGTRSRLDQLLNQANVVATQSAELISVNRASLDRTVSNVRDATDYGNRLVQKIYGNPFYLSPFYKPTKEDIAAQDFYDAANTFMLGAKELKDTITAMQALRAGKSISQMTSNEVKVYDHLYQRARELETQLQQVSQHLAAGLRTSTRR